MTQLRIPSRQRMKNEGLGQNTCLRPVTSRHTENPKGGSKIKPRASLAQTKRCHPGTLPVTTSGAEIQEMRDWVKLYLLEEVEKTNGGHRIGREQAEYGMNQIKGELENDETVFNRLADKLRTHFSAYGFASEGWALKQPSDRFCVTFQGKFSFNSSA